MSLTLKLVLADIDEGCGVNHVGGEVVDHFDFLGWDKMQEDVSTKRIAPEL